MEIEYRAGDIVDIISSGKIYSTHKILFKKLKFTNINENYFEPENSNVTDWEIFNMITEDNTTYIAIRKNGRELLIRSDGIKLSKKDIADRYNTNLKLPSMTDILDSKIHSFKMRKELPYDDYLKGKLYDSVGIPSNRFGHLDHITSDMIDAYSWMIGYNNPKRSGYANGEMYYKPKRYTNTIKVIDHESTPPWWGVTATQQKSTLDDSPVKLIPRKNKIQLRISRE